LIKYSIINPHPRTYRKEKWMEARDIEDRTAGADADAGADAANKWTVETWTTDGKPPVCHVYYNAHGALWPDDGLPPPQTGTYDIDLKIFSTIGDKPIESVTGIINNMEGHPEFNGKGIDRCFLSMLRRVTRKVAHTTNGDPDKIFNAVTEEAKEMYGAAGIHFDKDEFKFVSNPDRPHYLQLYQNIEEVFRTKPKGSKSRQLRAAAGDLVSSTLNDYGVWIFFTNLRIFQNYNLSLQSFTEDALKHEPANRKASDENLFLSSESTNSINMVSRRNNQSIGAFNWISAIKDIGPMDEDAKTRAIVAIGNLWKTRVTTLHEILSIFAPFEQKGFELGFPHLKLKMLSTTCRVLRSGFSFPRTDKDLEVCPVWYSQDFDRSISSPSPSPPPPQESLWRRLCRFITKSPPQLPDNINDAIDEAMKDDEPVVTSPQTQSPLEKRLNRSPSKSPSRSRAHSVPPSRKKRGGTKRKNSKHTRRRLRLRLRLRPRH
jgi:hypothetical protein